MWPLFNLTLKLYSKICTHRTPILPSKIIVYNWPHSSFLVATHLFVGRLFFDAHFYIHMKVTVGGLSCIFLYVLINLSSHLVSYLAICVDINFHMWVIRGHDVIQHHMYYYHSIMFMNAPCFVYIFWSFTKKNDIIHFYTSVFFACFEQNTSSVSLTRLQANVHT